MPTRAPAAAAPGAEMSLRERRPTLGRRFRRWIADYTGVWIADTPVCAGHVSPWDFFRAIHLGRPPLALVLGPRGGGKSFLSALDTHLTSRWRARHATRILGGSKAQSAQVYEALRDLIRLGDSSLGDDAGAVARLMKDEAFYENGSSVKILAASSTSVRGPHVPSLRIDEVDEVDDECREAAMGMCMNKHGLGASVVMTSTWHRVNGPMARLMERARAGDFPLFSFCAFEVLERCPDERSGPRLEKCPTCPLVTWCHSDRDSYPGWRPKAKRSRGHYAIDALIQKARATSIRTFEADYLCLGPKADGLWFTEFSPADHVAERADYDPRLPVYLAVDTGVVTGAVLFQVAPVATPGGPSEEVRVFADYLSDGVSAEGNARALLGLARERCNGRIDAATTDPAGDSRTAIGPTVLGEYERSGLRLLPWGHKKKLDGLALVTSFLRSADGRCHLVIHPRCASLVAALQSYRRARRHGQWIDDAEDPQHPQEDLVDALRGGLVARFPEGRVPERNFARVLARQVF